MAKAPAPGVLVNTSILTPAERGQLAGWSLSTAQEDGHRWATDASHRSPNSGTCQLSLECGDAWHGIISEGKGPLHRQAQGALPAGLLCLCSADILGWVTTLCHGDVLSTAGYLVASLASTHPHHSPDSQKMSSEIAKCPSHRGETACNGLLYRQTPGGASPESHRGCLLFSKPFLCPWFSGLLPLTFSLFIILVLTLNGAGLTDSLLGATLGEVCGFVDSMTLGALLIKCSL